MTHPLTSGFPVKSGEWREIPGFDGYEASTSGQIRSVDRVVRGRDSSQRRVAGRLLKPRNRSDGTRAVNLWSNNTYRQVPVKDLILETFDCARPTGFEAVHVNGDRSDNRLRNLRWQLSSR